ncbi:MAG: helix-turn-helix domain-containing protein [Deinococcota bacterium]|jgi:putative transcriptional regulator|nr:helix-turn-helix domain-containing protein [Deinococcota bacterium]
MKEELFQALLESVREGSRILRGGQPARVFKVEEPDVKAIRRRYGMSRTGFAAMLGISERTLEGWEQKRRKPKGPAQVLLRIVAKHPEAVLDAVQPVQPRSNTSRTLPESLE